MFVILTVAVGVAAMVELVKNMTPWSLRPATKGLISIVLAVVLAMVLTDGMRWQLRTEIALGCLGMAPLFHALEALLRLARDNQKSQVVTRANGVPGRIPQGLRPGSR